MRDERTDGFSGGAKPEGAERLGGSFCVVIVASEVVGDDVAVDDVGSELDLQHRARARAALFAQDGQRAKVVASLS
ncbi:hypothetical protein WMF28_39715 [Sorangium sp. So ce590]|uniref:hypothetical protein n=1 Tax=Sorangium sp. So ce590 TaxID=3133317 RepID=UPI003F6044CF